MDVKILHHSARRQERTYMKTIVVTGATGFVGQKLVLSLLRKGHDIRVVTRNIASAKNILPYPISYFEWDGLSAFPQDALSGSHAVIHLAGENIASGRWSAKRKAAIMKSRTEGTKALVEAINKVEAPPQVLIGTSAVGIYGDRDQEELGESSSYGEGFLTEVCKGWEKSYEAFKGRLAILRVGVVLGHGGALDKMLLPFRLGIGGKLSSGRQWMSWIHISDLVNMYLHALEQDSITGPYNAVAPAPVTNEEFTKVMGKALVRPTLFPAPKLVIQALFGEMSQVVLGSQKVSSKKILETKFKFNFPSIDQALKDLLIPGGYTGAHLAEFNQWIPQSREKVFDFFSQAENLEKITPDWIQFKVEKKSTKEIIEGSEIDYRLKIKGVPASWKSLIKTWKPGEMFVDEQLKGPYSIWLHTHSFEDMKDGTLITDRVIYKVPLGPIGSIVEFIMVRMDIQKIFDYRKSKLNLFSN